MSDICQSCTLKVLTSQGKVVCYICTRKYHASCVNLTQIDLSYLKEKDEKWQCQQCLKTHRKGSNRAESPLLPSDDKLDLILAELAKIKNSQDSLSSDFQKIRTAQESISADLLRLQSAQETVTAKVSDIEASQNSRFDILNTQLESLSTTLTAVDVKIEQHSQILNSHSLEISKCKADIQQLQTCNSQRNPAQVEETIKETLDRIQRANNIIIYNVPESDNDTDIRLVHDVTRLILGDGTQLPLDIIRIGKKTLGNKNPRPIKVTYPTSFLVRQLLRNKVRLANSTYSSVNIKSDLTPKQASYLTFLRSELKRRSENGETNLTIKYVNGTPTITQLPKN